MRILIHSKRGAETVAKFFGLTKAGKPSKVGKKITVTYPEVTTNKGIARRLRKAVMLAGLAQPGTLVPVEFPES